MGPAWACAAPGVPSMTHLEESISERKRLRAKTRLSPIRRCSAGVPQNTFKHALLDHSVRGTDPVSLRLSNLK